MADKPYRDPKTKHIESWKWRDLEPVQKELDIKEIPDYIQQGFGEFMNEQAGRTQRGEMTLRDLLKAYIITRSSVNRGGLSHASASRTGMKLPNTGGIIRPEGAAAEWLGTPMGQKWLNAAERGEIHAPAAADMQTKFAPFGMANTLADNMNWAAEHLPLHGTNILNNLGADKTAYRTAAKTLPGIGPAKGGFLASLLGRGDVPTLDARQIKLHTGQPTKDASKHMSRMYGAVGDEAVYRLAARQAAMGFDIDPSLEPHYQHLAHHAVWDKTSGDETTHDDLMRAMRGYAEGGDVNPQTQAMRRAVARYNEGKSVKAKHPAVYPAVPEIPKAQINSMAERMYAQMTGQSNPNAKTQIQMAREKDLPIDVREHAAPLPKPVIDMAQHKGAHIVGVPGDTSIGGMLPPGEGGLERSSHAAVTLHGIGDKQFEHDVPQYGGEMYGGYGHPFKWAGGEAGVRPIEKAVKQIHAYDPEAKIMGQFVKMTPQSLDFALHNLDTMLQYMEPHKLPPEQRELLDRLLAGKYGTHPAMAHSPGFADPHELLLQAQQDSKLRKKAVQILATKKNMPAGTGSWEDVQYAISHPHLRNMETGAGGSTIMEMDPHESYKNLFSPNPTYKHELPTKEEGVGRTEFMQPAELAYPRSLAYAKEAIQRLPEKKRARVQPFNMMKMIGMRELVDPQYIDQLGQYNQRMRELLGTGHQGYAEGGEVKQEPSQDEMMAHVMLSKSKPALISLKSIGAD
jgi:hypothetical protein